MAAAASVSELRVVLLGGSYSQRNSVGNFLLGVKAFCGAPSSCVRISGPYEEKKITVINTPNLQFSKADKLTEFIKDCVRASAPGPHVFLLVLQPENFTETDQTSLYLVLGRFSDQSFDHSMVLIMPRRQEGLGFKEKYMKTPVLAELIRKCQYRYLKFQDIEHLELITRLGQIVRENNGEHMSYEEFEEPASTLSSDLQSKKSSILSTVTDAGIQALKQIPTHISSLWPNSSTGISELRIVLFGKSEDKKAKLTKLITGGQNVHQKHSSCVSFSGEWRGKTVTVVKTPDMFSQSVETFIEEIQNCVRLCPPGPNVLLLLVKPSEFSDINKKTLKFILSLFGQNAFKHSMIIFTHKNEMSVSVNELLKDCGGRCYTMFEEEREHVMEKIEEIVQKNQETFLTFTEETTGPKLITEQTENSPLNLVLCGSRGAGKTSAAEAILGRTDLHPASKPSESVKHQGEVCGRLVSVVELPPLYEKPHQEVMEESLRCVSLCEPEGVHVFILVLPVGPLTDEDKGELQTIQDTFSSRVNDFTMILFTVDSDPAAPDDDNFVKKNNKIQELCQSCGGRYVVLNTKDRKQIPELLEAVDKMFSEGSKCFSNNMFTRANIERVSKLQAELQDVKQKLEVKEGLTEDLREKEEEMKKKEEDLKKKHREELKALRAQAEQERKQRVQQLKDKDECMEKEREKRKKESEEEAKRQRKKEEAQQQQWKQKLEDKEKKVQSEKTQRENAEKKLEQCRREMKKDRDIRDKEKDQIWERLLQDQKQNLEDLKQKLEEERTSHRKLQEEYNCKRKKWIYPWFILLFLIIIFLLLYVLMTQRGL